MNLAETYSGVFRRISDEFRDSERFRTTMATCTFTVCFGCFVMKMQGLFLHFKFSKQSFFKPVTNFDSLRMIAEDFNKVNFVEKQ